MPIGGQTFTIYGFLRQSVERIGGAFYVFLLLQYVGLEDLLNNLMADFRTWCQSDGLLEIGWLKVGVHKVSTAQTESLQNFSEALDPLWFGFKFFFAEVWAYFGLLNLLIVFGLSSPFVGLELQIYRHSIFRFFGLTRLPS